MAAILEVSNACHTLKSGKKDKVVLQGVSFCVASGNVFALMGPSGAGKTMLMNFLTLERSPGKKTGRVTLNNEQLTTNIYKKYCSFVTQQDQHWIFLTCRETLMFASELLIPERAKRLSQVEALLESLGLKQCQTTRIGNQYVPGLSGGQRRRLSIAISLIKNPIILFLDEPTSGLDAAAAFGIIESLCVLARSSDRLVVCTVHQPSGKVFSKFDKILLLSQGRTAYCGSREKVGEYFSSIGYPFPIYENPADFMLDLVNLDFGDGAQVESILVSWVSSAPADSKQDLIARKRSSLLTLSPPPRHSLALEIVCLTKRQILLTLRDPLLYTLRIGAFLVGLSFFACIYIESRQHVQEQILNKFWVITWFIGLPTNLAVISCFGQNLEFSNVNKELKNGMCRLWTYVLASSLVQMPAMLLLSIACCLVPGVIANLHLAKLAQFIMIHAAILLQYENTAQLCSLAHDSPLVGMMLYLCYWFTGFLFCGAVLPLDDVPIPFRYIGYICPMRYALRSAAYIEFSDLEFDGAVLNATSPFGFTCTQIKPLQRCFGRTGSQALRSLHMIIDNVNDENNIALDICIVLGTTLFAKVLFVAVLLWKIRPVQPALASNIPGENQPEAKEDELESLAVTEPVPAGFALQAQISAQNVVAI